MICPVCMLLVCIFFEEAFWYGIRLCLLLSAFFSYLVPCVGPGPCGAVQVLFVANVFISEE